MPRNVRRLRSTAITYTRRRYVIHRAIALGVIMAIAACGDPFTQPLTDPRGLLLVVRGTGPAAEIYVIRPDGTERRQLTRNAVLDGVPDWSPDGRQIVFVSARDSTPGAPTRRPEIFLMNRDGSGVRRIHETTDVAWHPRWSPDGQRIAFERYDRSVSKFRPYVMNADGSNVQLLSSAPGENFSVEWSPVGTRLLFLSNRPPRFWWTMYVMRVDGSGEQQLAGDSACTTNVSDPRWSPDGSQIAYVCLSNSEPAIYTIRADGTDPVQLTAPGWGPVWSPDGRELAFSSHRDGESHVYVRDMASGAVSRLTSDSADYLVWAWGGIR